MFECELTDLKNGDINEKTQLKLSKIFLQKLEDL